MTVNTSRRTVLRGAVVTLGAGVLAGCSQDGDDDEDEEGEDDEDEEGEDDEEDTGAENEDGEEGNDGVSLGYSVDDSIPRASFEFEYDATDEDGVLTIMHAAGDPVVAATLFVRGEGIVDPDGVAPDVTSPDTSWGQAGGETSDRRDGAPAVVSGDELTVGARRDYDVRLVWDHPERDTAQMLAEDQGPDA